MILVRSIGSMASNIVRQAIRSGNWWLPVVIVLLAVTALVAATAKVVVPTAVYVLF